MKFVTKILLSVAVATISWPVTAQSVLSVSDDTMTPTIILPESVETDTKAMLDNWYLKNYAVLDYDADSRSSDDFSDEVLLERLMALPTVIEMPYNSVVKNTIRFYANRKQLVENLLGLSLYYMPIFEEALERNGMPLELRYLPVIESALVPTAVSKAGAAGLWQFMPATATGLGLEVNSLIDQRRDPYLSSEAAARYLKQLYTTYKDWSLAIAAYNCGPGNVNKALRRVGDGKHDFWDIYPFLPSETRGYVPAFIAANYIMTYHKDHNISPALAKRPIVVDTVHVNKRVHFEQISQVMEIPIDELRMLNPQFRQDLIPGDIKPYSLVLPSLQVYAYIANEDSIINHNASNYARRGVVEPATGGVTGRDSRGEYYEEEVIQYHTVKRGETLTKIANKYGVTIASIHQNNKVGKSVRQGQRLKIKTMQRKYKTPAEELATQKQTTTPADSTATSQADNKPVQSVTAETDSISTADEVAAAFVPQQEIDPKEGDVKVSVKKPEPAKKTTTSRNTSNAASKPITHTVKRGESLYKIAIRYGVTIQAIKKENNLKSDQIQAGQRIRIPSK
ncbi:MAG: transglycosylase SLT domain-containing protein [Muribaculaceae bacterium]|nr:transglycosylase SLT domain-containing protein [Muribaculaceae bacterium]